MEYLAGEDLQRRLARPEKMPISRRIEIAIEICHGVEHAHAHGIVHRDLKPANIYLAENAGVKILDFGLARPMASQLTHSNMLMGTINYMAPEQVRAERADHRSDIFSLGVVLYELFGGRKAFDGDSVASTLYKILEQFPEPLPNLDPELPPSLWPIVERALAKNREERYQQVSALVGDLQELAHPSSASVAVSPLLSAPPVSRVGSMAPVSVAAPPTPTPAPSSAPPLTPPPVSVAPGRKIAGAAALVAAVALVAAGTAWFVAHRAGPNPPATDQSAAASSTQPPAQTPPAPQTSEPTPPTAPSAAPTPAASPGSDAKVVTPAEGAAIAARQQADAARGRMTESRAAAQAAGAPERAATSFHNADRRAQDAERLFRARKYEEAAGRYYEASGLFRDAEAAARVAASAPSAAASEPSQPPQQRLPQQGAAPSGAGAGQQQPSSLPSPPPAPPAPVATQPQSSVPAATPAKPSSPPPSAPQGPSDEERVSDLVNRYREALEARSLDRLKQLWPGLAGASETAIRDEFQHASRISVDISSPQIALNGGTGRVTFVRHYSLVTVDGQRLQSSSNVAMDVRRAGSGWVIESVRFSPR
jgi:serine/threonine-protein kinase